mmetsp:Transcript_80845/g.249431  ORF Transcript_80845/g.249431 Transcript_80845/m.249431 type:complete len:203 (+) Transcript_80845:207-815(+)
MQHVNAHVLQRGLAPGRLLVPAAATTAGTSAKAQRGVVPDPSEVRESSPVREGPQTHAPLGRGGVKTVLQEDRLAIALAEDVQEPPVRARLPSRLLSGGSHDILVLHPLFQQARGPRAPCWIKLRARVQTESSGWVPAAQGFRRAHNADLGTERCLAAHLEDGLDRQPHSAEGLRASPIKLHGPSNWAGGEAGRPTLTSNTK